MDAIVSAFFVHKVVALCRVVIIARYIEYIHCCILGISCIEIAVACLYLDVSACEHVLYVPALAILLEEPQLCSLALLLGSALELVCHVVLNKHRIVPDGIGYAVYATVLRESLRTCCQRTDENRNE